MFLAHRRNVSADVATWPENAGSESSPWGSLMAASSFTRPEQAQARPRPRHPILETLHGERFMRISMSLIEVCGRSLDGAAMVATAIGWTLGLPESREGWFYKSIAEWEEETSVSRHRQQLIRNRLRNREPKFWFEQKRGCPPTNWFRLDLDVLEGELAETMETRRRREIEKRAMSRKPAVPIVRKPDDQTSAPPRNTRPGNGLSMSRESADHSQEITHRDTSSRHMEAKRVEGHHPKIEGSKDDLRNRLLRFKANHLRRSKDPDGQI